MWSRSAEQRLIETEPSRLAEEAAGQEVPEDRDVFASALVVKGGGSPYCVTVAFWTPR